MQRLLHFLILPAEISAFEQRHLARLRKVGVFFYVIGVPTLTGMAWSNHTGPLAAFCASSGLLLAVLASLTLKNPRTKSVFQATAGIWISAMVVYFGHHIDMSVLLCSSLLMCVVTSNPLVVICATVSAVLIPLVGGWVLPTHDNPFAYQASYWTTVLAESILVTLISRSLFDNVIGLERIVQLRTQELDATNREMRLLLDNVQQGFLTIDRDGRLAPARSAAIDRWFGVPAEDARWFDQLANIAPVFAASSRLAWMQVVDDLLPLEVALDQIPRQLDRNGARYRVEYRAIGEASPCLQFLVIVTDITLEVEREKADLEGRESVAIFDRVLTDHSGFETFFEEASSIVEELRRPNGLDLARCQRLVHTLKGNAALYGLATVARQCEALEDRMAEARAVPSELDFAGLSDRWTRLAGVVARWLGVQAKTIQLDEEQHAELELAIGAGEPHKALLRRVQQLKLEPTVNRLEHFADQARRIGERLEKTPITVKIEDHGVRLDSRHWGPFWGSFIHSVRNALCHGIELPAARAAAGKPPGGTITLRTTEADGVVVVEIADDGQGINWSAVRERAARAGLPSENQADLEKALFTNGISTAAEVTDLSGRGVGLGALRESTQEMGGELSVESTSGVGTLLRMTFPPSVVRDIRSAIQPGTSRQPAVSASVLTT